MNRVKSVHKFRTVTLFIFSIESELHIVIYILFVSNYIIKIMILLLYILHRET